MWEDTEAKKTKKLTQDEIKRRLTESLVMSDRIESEELIKNVQEVEDPEKVAELIQECESIIRTNKKGIFRIAYRQGKIFKKFKNKGKFTSLVDKLGIHRTAIILKINIFKLCQKYTDFLNSSVGLGFFKNYYKNIKVICNENECEFL